MGTQEAIVWHLWPHKETTITIWIIGEVMDNKKSNKKYVKVANLWGKMTWEQKKWKNIVCAHMLILWLKALLFVAVYGKHSIKRKRGKRRFHSYKIRLSFFLFVILSVSLCFFISFFLSFFSFFSQKKLCIFPNISKSQRMVNIVIIAKK